MDIKETLAAAFDESPEEGLQKHDQKYHGGHFDGGTCKYREEHGLGSAPGGAGEELHRAQPGMAEVSSEDVIEAQPDKTATKKKLSVIAEGEKKEDGQSVTAEEDAAYMDAVKRGDMETAQRMVREAAEKAGFATEAYHGTKADFNQFNMVSDMNFGAHFGTKRAATDRTDMKSWETGDAHVGKYALRMANPLRLPDVFQSAGSLASYIFASRGEKDTGVYPNGKFHGEFDLAKGVFKDTPELDEVRAAYNAVFEGQPFKGKTGWEANPILMQAYLDYLRSLGYDSVVYKNKVEDAGEDSYLVMSSEQIKSAAPVTYNDAGDVIPLSQRFNAASPDIRYSADQKKAKASWSRRAKALAQAAAKMIERFMPGVKVRLSDTPYEGGGDERKSISGVFTGSAADYANRSRLGGVDDGPSLVKVGSGTGDRVYGWGLYGSSNRDVAESYVPKDITRVIINGKDETNNYKENYEREEKWKSEIADALVATEGDIQAAKNYIARRIQEAEEDIDYEGAGTDVAAEKEQLEDFRKALSFLQDHENAIKVTRGGSVYEQTFFTNRAPGDESHLLKWYEPVSEEQVKWIERRLKTERVSLRKFDPDELGTRPVRPDELRAMKAGDLYQFVSNALGSPKLASEFLARAGIDGVKYPVDSYGGKGVKDGDKAGWNYVSFHDDNIRVDHKWTNEEMRYFKGAGGKVVGTYNRRTGEVVLYPGADKNTIAHELGGHATWQYAEQLAKDGDKTLLRKMNEVVDSAPKNITQEVAQNYGKETAAVQREEIWAHVMGNRGSAAIKEALATKKGRHWWGRFWDTAKDAWRGLASKVGLNRVKTADIASMSPDEFADYMAKEMTSGRVLGKIRYGQNGTDLGSESRKSFLGEKGAANLGIGKKSEAEAMEKSGASREDIWRSTGWWRGKDGEWRVEMPELQLRDSSDENEALDAFYDSESVGTIRLGDLLEDGSPILKAYPQMADTTIIWDKESTEESAGFNPDRNEIEINNGMFEKYNEAWGEIESTGETFETVLQHELQHVIQGIEGFAEGGNPNEFWNPIRTANAGPALQKYKALAGEAEARLAAKRYSMSPEERSKRPPWEDYDVPESAQTIRRNARSAASMDAAPDDSATLKVSLQQHDEQHHPNGFNPETDTCKFREKIMEQAEAVGEEDTITSATAPTSAQNVQEATLDAPQGASQPSQAKSPMPAPAPSQPAPSAPPSPPPSPYAGIPKKKVAEFKRLLAKNHPDLDPDALLSEISKIKDKSLQKDAFLWALKGAVALPEDINKIRKARQLANRAKMDPLSYDTPQTTIDAVYALGYREPITPIPLEEIEQNPLFFHKEDCGHGVVVFDIDDDEETREMMRRVIDTHWGYDCNPWCLLEHESYDWRGCYGDDASGRMKDPDNSPLDAYDRRQNRKSAEAWWNHLGREGRLKFAKEQLKADYIDKKKSDRPLSKAAEAEIEKRAEKVADSSVWNNEADAAEYFATHRIMPYDERFSALSDSSKDFWYDTYTALPKRVAFKDGKLLAFMATDGGDSWESQLSRASDSELQDMFPREFDDYTSEMEERKEDFDIEHNLDEDGNPIDEDDREEFEPPSFSDWLLEEVNEGYIEEWVLRDAFVTEEWWDKQDKPHKGIPLGMMPCDKSPASFPDVQGFYRSAELKGNRIEYSGEWIKGTPGRPGYMKLDQEGRIKEDVTPYGIERIWKTPYYGGQPFVSETSETVNGREISRSYSPRAELIREEIHDPEKGTFLREWDYDRNQRLVLATEGYVDGAHRSWDAETGNLINDVSEDGTIRSWSTDGTPDYIQLPNGDCWDWINGKLTMMRKGNIVKEFETDAEGQGQALTAYKVLGQSEHNHLLPAEEEWHWNPDGSLQWYSSRKNKIFKNYTPFGYPQKQTDESDPENPVIIERDSYHEGPEHFKVSLPSASEEGRTAYLDYRQPSWTNELEPGGIVSSPSWKGDGFAYEFGKVAPGTPHFVKFGGKSNMPGGGTTSAIVVLRADNLKPISPDDDLSEFPEEEVQAVRMAIPPKLNDIGAVHPKARIMLEHLGRGVKTANAQKPDPFWKEHSLPPHSLHAPFIKDDAPPEYPPPDILRVPKYGPGEIRRPLD